MFDVVYASRHDRNRRAFTQWCDRWPNSMWLPNTADLDTAKARAASMVSTNMYWLITDDIDFNHDLDLTWKPESWDRQFMHQWPTLDSQGAAVQGFSGVWLIPRRGDAVLKEMAQPQHTQRQYDLIKTSWRDGVRDVADAISRSQDKTNSEMYWLISDDVSLIPGFDLSWHPPEWDRRYVHVWRVKDKDAHTGVYLVPGDYTVDADEQQQGSPRGIKQMDTEASTLHSFDVFFISYDEANADQQFANLTERFPAIKRVHGIKGIHLAHLRCAELSETSMFWTIDADTEVDIGFDFDYLPPDYDRRYLHIWHSRNPVNGLSYGWGGIKLWPTRLVLEFRDNWLDFTTTVGQIKLMPDIVSTSRFNVDALSSWRSGFRESVKLCHNISQGDQQESLQRLLTWLNVCNDSDHAADAVQGARAGYAFFVDSKTVDRRADLSCINDFAWLEGRFNNREQLDNTYDRHSVLQDMRTIADV